MTRKMIIKGESLTEGNGKLARLTVLALLVCCAAGLGFSIHANYVSPYRSHTDRFIIENLGIAFLILEVVLAYILKRLQDGRYWLSWLQLQKTNLDERQRHVRQKVFEQAYAYTLIIFLATSIYLNNVQILYSTSAPGNYNLLSRVAWATGILTIALPSILAAWRKDS